MNKVEDQLSAREITEGLQTRLIGQRLLYYPSLTSTMEAARQAVHEGAAEGTVILAGEQTAGRGRLKRAWLTPTGNIALSVILCPSLANLPSMIMLASLAVARSIEAVTGLRPQVKWPNDILISGRKVSGILIENVLLGSKLTASIIGIGINVNLKVSDLPEIRDIATSLSDELGKEVSRLKLICCLLEEMENLYLALSAGESPSASLRTGLFEAWRANLVTLGKKVRATTGDAVYEGTAESVDPDGSLWLRLPDGSLTRIVAGDVTLR